MNKEKTDFMLIEKEKPSFNFENFKNKAIEDMRSGKSLSLIDKDGVFIPLMKELLEAALGLTYGFLHRRSREPEPP